MKILRNKYVLFLVGYVIFFTVCLIIYGDFLPFWLILSLVIPFGVLVSGTVKFFFDRLYGQLPEICPSCGKHIMRKHYNLERCPFCSAKL